MDGREYEYDAGGYCLKYRELARGNARTSTWASARASARVSPMGDTRRFCITGCQGGAWAVSVPEQIEGVSVAAIGPKAFLGRKKLREVRLPPGIESIGDWAFAYCASLERVTVPAGCSHMGKSLFLDCGKLECVEGCGGAGEAWTEQCGRLLAAAVTRLEAYYLLDPPQVGSREWLAKWDARLEAVMCEEDQEGYSKQAPCGEEDYGSMDLEAFLQAKRQKKVRLAMLRLLCCEGLSGGMRECLEGYLVSHTKGCESEEAWQVVLEEGESHPEYARLFLELGCADRGNMEAMVAQMREDQPQLRAAFLRRRQRRPGCGDFFAGLSL